MNVHNPNEASIIRELNRNFRVSEEEAQYLLKIIQINLHDLLLAMKKAGKKRQWDSLQSLNHKLEGLAINLKWERLQRFCSFMFQTINDCNEQNLDGLLKKLPILINQVFTEQEKII